MLEIKYMFVFDYKEICCLTFEKVRLRISANKIDGMLISFHLNGSRNESKLRKKVETGQNDTLNK